MPQLMASDGVDLGCFVMLCALCCDGSARSPCFSSSSCSMVLAMWIHFPSPCHPGNKHAMPCQAHILLKKSEKKLEMNEMIQNDSKCLLNSPLFAQFAGAKSATSLEL